LNLPNQGMPMQGGVESPATNGFGAPMGGEGMMFQPQQAQLTPPEPEEPMSEEDLMLKEQEIILRSVNLAMKMDDDELKKIGDECKKGFDLDQESRSLWLEETDQWLRLARQVREMKMFPWPEASNIKYPLISTAALQFSARAYPTLVPADGKLVKTRLWGKDSSGEKRKKGERIGTYMSWQFSEDMDYWEEDMDKLLIMLPVCGMVFKKTFYNPITEKIDSVLVYPENFVIDYWAQSIEKSMRYSEVVPMTEQEIKERQLNEHYLDVDLGKPSNDVNPADPSKDVSKGATDFTTPFQIIEQHTWLDLDDDGLREPYIVTFEYRTGKVLRISSRFGADNIVINSKGDVIGFKADTYYTKFGFIPNPDGSFYDLGFGHLLGPLNESVNTIINQLVDAGTLSNLQSGFIGKGLRIKMSDQPFRPGEWRAVNATGEDLNKQIVPLPVKEPSNVLLTLLGTLVTSGKELASVAEIFVGKMPGQNTPATTTMATIEQGMKVFTAIYKRVYRALTKEYKKVFKLNHFYLDPNTYAAVLDEAIGPEDFDESTYDVCPSADPTATTQTEKLLKAQALMELLPTGLIDPMKVVMRVLEAQEQPQWEELIPGMAETGTPQPPKEKPDPKLMAMQEKAKVDQQKAQLDMVVSERDAQMRQMEKIFDLKMKEREHQMDMQFKQMQGQLDTILKARTNEIFMAEAKNKAMVSAQEGQQRLEQNDAMHMQKMQQSKETQSSKSQSSKSGGKTQSRKPSSGQSKRK